MKFLVLALYVCAASAASVAYKPWQPAQQVAQAFASVGGPVPEATYKAQPAYKAVVQPAYKAVVQPAYKAVVQPAYKAVVQPAYKAVVQPAYKAVVQPAYKPVVQPAYKAVVQPAVVPVTVAKAVVSTAPVVVAKTAAYIEGKEGQAAILRYDNDVSADGYNFAYETENGIAASSSGTLKQGDKTNFLTVQGAYQYTGSDGLPVEFSYIADENGYQPKSSSLPVGPAIPEYIIRALEYISAHPSKEAN